MEPSITTSTGNPQLYREKISVPVFRAVVTDENDYYGGGKIEKEGRDQERITDNNSVYSRE